MVGAYIGCHTKCRARFGRRKTEDSPTYSINPAGESVGMHLGIGLGGQGHVAGAHGGRREVRDGGRGHLRRIKENGN